MVGKREPDHEMKCLVAQPTYPTILDNDDVIYSKHLSFALMQCEIAFLVRYHVVSK